MSVSASRFTEFIRRYQALQAAARIAADKRAAPLNRAAQAMLNELIQDVVRASNGQGAAITSKEHLRALERRLDMIQARAMRGQGKLYRPLFDAILADITKDVPDVYRSLGKPVGDQLARVAASFTNRANNELYRVGFRQWMTQVQKINADVRGVLIETMAKGEIGGWTQRRTVQELLGNPLFRAENLPPIGEHAQRVMSGGTMDPSLVLDRRAHAIVRTESTAARNAGIQEWSREAGFDKFINANDAPVAKVCKAATAQPPMTMEEWSASPWGTPPRHPNCDSDLIPVPDDLGPDTYRDVVIGDVTDDPEGLLAAAAELAGA